MLFDIGIRNRGYSLPIASCLLPATYYLPSQSLVDNGLTEEIRYQ